MDGAPAAANGQPLASPTAGVSEVDSGQPLSFLLLLRGRTGSSPKSIWLMLGFLSIPTLVATYYLLIFPRPSPPDDIPTQDCPPCPPCSSWGSPPGFPGGDFCPPFGGPFGGWEPGWWDIALMVWNAWTTYAWFRSQRPRWARLWRAVGQAWPEPPPMGTGHPPQGPPLQEGDHSSPSVAPWAPRESHRGPADAGPDRAASPPGDLPVSRPQPFFWLPQGSPPPGDPEAMLRSVRQSLHG